MHPGPGLEQVAQVAAEAQLDEVDIQTLLRVGRSVPLFHYFMFHVTYISSVGFPHSDLGLLGVLGPFFSLGWRPGVGFFSFLLSAFPFKVIPLRKIQRAGTSARFRCIG